jgi:hypothetical protein
MKKYIPILLLFIACNKDEEKKGTCYECTVYPGNGQAEYKTNVCTDRIDTVKFTDPQGRSQGSVCEPL